MIRRWIGRPGQSLFHRTISTVVLAFILIESILIAATVNYIVLPMAKRSTDDLSALLVLSAQTWVELPPNTRPDFERELADKHHFLIFDVTQPLSSTPRFRPYIALLENALSVRTGEAISIKTTHFETAWYWAEIHTGGQLIRIGFSSDRLNMNPPKLLVLVFIVTVLLSLLTAWVLARRITQPLASFSEAAQRVGDGDIPDALPETGIKELTGFANAFNRMVWQVRALLASRTTMLAGISHDLRTPLARMRLAIEMLPENSAPVLIDHLKKDLAQMDQLIGEFLTLSRDLGKETPQSIELNTFIEELVAEINYGGGAIEFSAQSPLVVQAGPLALRRIVNNLMSNALRYGEGNPIEIAFEIRSKQVLIQIKDRGLGIPQAELENVFRPFYRLESSRNTETGGSGLGLALCRQLAEANGWKIELLPREGGGITAQLSVPLTKVE